MERMKRGIIFVGAAALLMMLASEVWALPMEGTTVKMGYDVDVPYTMTDQTTNQVYASFCLEKQQTFYAGHTYYVSSVGDYASGGGVGAVSGQDPVSDESKWLYAAFMSGVFDGLKDAALMVQNAIWYLEKEIDVATDWTELKEDYYDPKVFDFNASGWQVVAVNLTDLNGHTADNQSQLVGVAPVPEPATLLLLGTGLVGLAGFGRRKIKRGL